MCFFEWGKWGGGKPVCLCIHAISICIPEPENCGHSSMCMDVSSGQFFHLWHLRHEAIWCAQPCLVFLTTGVTHRQQRKGNLGCSFVHQHPGRSRTDFLFGVAKREMLFLLLSPILSLHLIPNGNTWKAQSGLPCPRVAHPCKRGTTTCRVQGVSRPSLPLASALQGLITSRAMLLYLLWVFSNSLLILLEVDHPVQMTSFHHSPHHPLRLHASVHKLAFASYCRCWLQSLHINSPINSPF